MSPVMSIGSALCVRLVALTPSPCWEYPLRTKMSPPGPSALTTTWPSMFSNAPPAPLPMLSKYTSPLRPGVPMVSVPPTGTTTLFISLLAMARPAPGLSPM